MVLLPSSAAATAKAKAWVAQQLQTDSYTTNQSTGSRAARLSELEKLAVDVADLEKQVIQARKRADYARRAREGTRTKAKAAARMPHDAPPPPPRRRWSREAPQFLFCLPPKVGPTHQLSESDRPSHCSTSGAEGQNR